MYTVTKCAEYPIHEAAEGGYYYTGVTAIQWAICKRMKTARKLLKRWAREFGYTVTTGRSAHKHSYMQATELPVSKYIGEDEYIVMKRGDKQYESGWHPYE